MRKLPHQKLLAYEVAMKLLEAVRDAKIRDAHLRDQAMRAAKSAVLNTAEAAGRVTRGVGFKSCLDALSEFIARPSAPA